ncbi:MAG: YsnF/AvaK domain-containing protein [Tunicatimonas sp.]
MSHTVVGIFNNVVDAEKAVDHLLSNGFSRGHIDIADHTDRDGYTDEHRDRDSDSIGGFFSSLFGGDSDDSRYHAEAASKGSVVTVHAQSKDEAERAADILDDYGTIDANQRAGARTETANLDADAKIDVVEEELEVGKRKVDTGGVRVRSRIVERPVEESIRLRSEHVDVERRPVNRKASEADLANFKEGTIEMTETAESAVVSKDARVVEEIHVDKTVEEHDEVIKDTVRSTEVDVEKVAGDKRAALTEQERLAKDKKGRV